VPPLSPGASSTGSTTVTIPGQTAPGTFYIIARADFGNTIAETSETNNTRWRPISIGPDLMFSSLSLSPVSLAAGANLTITDKVTNQGGGVAPPSTTRFYLSTNATLDGADVVLGSRLVPELAVAASSSGSTIVAIPAATVPGTYQVIAQTDGDATVAESVETNNVSVIRSIQVTAGP
jgi:serralysin